MHDKENKRETFLFGCLVAGICSDNGRTEGTAHSSDHIPIHQPNKNFHLLFSKWLDQIRLMLV